MGVAVGAKPGVARCLLPAAVIVDDPAVAAPEQRVDRETEIAVVIRRNEAERLPAQRRIDEEHVPERLEQRRNRRGEVVIVGEADHAFDIVAEQVVHISPDRVEAVMHQADLEPSP